MINKAGSKSTAKIRIKPQVTYMWFGMLMTSGYFNSSKVYRSGICTNESLELFYRRQKVLTIPSDAEKFTVLILPQQ